MEIQIFLSFHEPSPGSANTSVNYRACLLLVAGCFHTHWWEVVTGSHMQLSLKLSCCESPKITFPCPLTCRCPLPTSSHFTALGSFGLLEKRATTKPRSCFLKYWPVNFPQPWYLPATQCTRTDVRSYEFTVKSGYTKFSCNNSF